METKSNHTLVGGVVLVLLVALLFFVMWLARIGGGEKKPYDLFFKQSVSGLAVGSVVTFSGVPVGEVKKIALVPESPEFVRVRILIDEDVPILQGTTASIASIGFTGVAQINLDGAVRGAPPITAIGPEGVPVIPTRPGALGELLSNAPQLLERLTTLTERLGQLLSDKNQASIASILASTERISRSLADRSPEIAAALADARVTIRQAGIAAEEFGKLAGTTNQLLNEDGKPLVADLRRTVANAERTLAAIETVVNDAKPGIQTLSKQTVPEIGQLVIELRQMSESLGAVAAKIDQDPRSALLGGRKLPDYEPAK